jgi:hypothetical protein
MRRLLLNERLPLLLLQTRHPTEPLLQLATLLALPLLLPETFLPLQPLVLRVPMRLPREPAETWAMERMPGGVAANREMAAGVENSSARCDHE